ncbi:MAG: DUF86 domain-containing protein [Defluviitaleaceae bacterium]|nr:DUF86 domain-containing protein [Defluviitaleaceae bacterium]
MSNNYIKDICILNKIIRYCAEADETIIRFGNSIDKLKTDNIYKNATAMCILQIGELVRHLSNDIVNEYDEMPWKQIKGMRNIAAHGYEDFDVEILWQTLKNDLPALRKYCVGILSRTENDKPL